MFEIETQKYSKANLERLAFYYEKIKKANYIKFKYFF